MTGLESVKAYKSRSTPFVRIEGLALSQGQAAPHGTSKPLSTPQSGQGCASRGLWRSEDLRPLCSIPRPHDPRAELALISGKIREGTGGPKGQEERSQQLPPDNPPLPGAPWTLL